MVVADADADGGLDGRREEVRQEDEGKTVRDGCASRRSRLPAGRAQRDVEAAAEMICSSKVGRWHGETKHAPGNAGAAGGGPRPRQPAGGRTASRVCCNKYSPLLPQIPQYRDILIANLQNSINF